VKERRPMKTVRLGIVAFGILCLVVMPVPAEEATPAPNASAVEELQKRIEALEARLVRLEETCRAGATPSASGSIPAPAIPPPETLDEVRGLVVEFEGNPEIGALCRPALEFQLQRLGYVVTRNAIAANAMLQIVTSGSELGRGFMGITSSEGEINLSFSAQLRGRRNDKILFQYSEDESGTPSSACADLAKDVAEALADAKKPTKKK
jgi:hypothetical protein